MKKLTDILDGFVKKVKTNEALSDVRFIHGGKTASAEKPVRSSLVACAVGAVQISEGITSGSECTAEFKFHVYAPENVGSRELSKLTHSLMEALWEADTEGIISSQKADEVKFDSELCTRVQLLTVTVKLLSSEGTDPEPAPQSQFQISLNGNLLPDVRAFSAEKHRELYAVRELLAGDTGKQLLTEEKFVIKLSVVSDKDIFAYLSDIDLTLCVGKSEKTYTGCTVTNSTEKPTAEGLCLWEYTLTSNNVKQG